MTIPNLRSVVSLSAKLSHHTIVLMLVCFLLIGPCDSAARSPEARPVARLIGSRVNRKSPTTVRDGKSTSADDAISTLVTAPSDVDVVERRAFNATNRVREKNGLPPLGWEQSLYRMACAHSQRMAVNGFFSHHTPDGLGLRDRARASGIRSFKVLAENIAYNQGYDDPGAFAVERWMVSPMHRANILSNEFQASAIGSFVGADQRIYLTQIFISR